MNPRVSRPTAAWTFAALALSAALVPADALALGRLLSDLGDIDSKQRLWLAAFGGLSLGVAFGLFVFEMRSRALAVAVRRLIDLIVGMDGRHPDEVRRQSPAGELARLSDELMFAAQRAARDRRDSEQKMASWEALFAAALDAMFGLDAAGRITYINPAAERLFRVKADESIGKLLSDVMLPLTHRSPDNAAFASDLATGKAIGRTQELVAQRGDGRQFPIEASIAEFGSGEQRGFVVIARDISQVRRGRAELHRLREQSTATAAELTAEIERLKRAQPPAAAAYGAEQLPPVLPAQRVAQRVPIEPAADRRVFGPGFTVEDVCGDAVRKLAARAERRGLRFRYEDGDVQGSTLRGDSARLRRVLIGLVDSVVRCAPSGEIVVHLSVHAGEGRHIELVTEITATAMTEADAERMIRPFVQHTVTRHDGGGYPGRVDTLRRVDFLGTAVVHGVAPAGGATFSFTLPYEVDLSQLAIDLGALPALAAPPRDKAPSSRADRAGAPDRWPQEYAKSALRLRKHADKANLIALWAEAHRLKDIWKQTGGRDDVGLLSALSHTARGGDTTNAVLLARRLADALEAATEASQPSVTLTA